MQIPVRHFSTKNKNSSQRKSIGIPHSSLKAICHNRSPRAPFVCKKKSLSLGPRSVSTVHSSIDTRKIRQESLFRKQAIWKLSRNKVMSNSNSVSNSMRSNVINSNNNSNQNDISNNNNNSAQNTTNNSPTPHVDKKANNLQFAKSPYLLQHKFNPVDWFEWNDTALKKAKELNRVIFLSVGYSACHWCHVLARESFEDENTAKFLNSNFINIKVDREERPDIDKIYMSFVQALTGHGGWPLSVWISPQTLTPITGGTYFPPKPQRGQPSFMQICQGISRAWQEKEIEVQVDSLQMWKKVAEFENQRFMGQDLQEIEKTAVIECYQYCQDSYDQKFGGFGTRPKFPRPSLFNFLYRISTNLEFSKQINQQAQNMLMTTLRNIGNGGIYDHLDGGIHRYSVDQYWHIPHYEKMLYDQAQIVESFLQAFILTKNSFFSQKATEILDYVQKRLTCTKTNGFLSAEDADSLLEFGKEDHAEGAFYVWTKSQIDKLLGQDAPIFNFFFGIEENGNAPAGSDPMGEFIGKNTLKVFKTVDETLEKFPKLGSTVTTLQVLQNCKKILLNARDIRPRPHLDDKITTSWNGLMISAFIKSAGVLSRPEFLSTGVAAAEFIRKTMWDEQNKKLFRTFRETVSPNEGFADDYAFLIQATLDLYEHTLDQKWILWAVDLQKTFDQFFWDNENGAYFLSSSRSENLIHRSKEDYDGAEPSYNSVATLNLQRLYWITENESFLKRAEDVFSSFAKVLKQSPHAVPWMCSSLDFYFSSPVHFTFSGDEKSPEFQKLLNEARKFHGANKIFSHARDLKTENPETVRNAQVTICVEKTCQPPISDSHLLAIALEKLKV